MAFFRNDSSLAQNLQCLDARISLALASCLGWVCVLRVALGFKVKPTLLSMPTCVPYLGKIRVVGGVMCGNSLARPLKVSQMMSW